MSVPRTFSACLFVCFLAATSSQAMAALSNGDFESATGDRFDDWSTGTATTSSYTVATSPMNISGNNSARVISSGKGIGDYEDAGCLWQQFSVDGMSDFQIDLDFAFLDCGLTNREREFSLLTYAADGTTLVDSLAIMKSATSGNHALMYYGTTATQGLDWRSATLIGDVTPNVNVAKTFDGENPVTNHLTLLGLGYGTDNYSLTMSLNGSNYAIASHNEDANYAIGNIAFLGASSSVASDFIVDNVSVQELTITPNPDPYNGNFETVVAGQFAGWQTTSSKPTYEAAISPMNIDGIYSCKMLGGSTEGGMLRQQFDLGGFPNFRVEMDVAFLVDQGTENDERLLSIMMYGADGSTIADSIGIRGGEAQVQYWSWAGGAWGETGVFADPTIDEGTLNSFDGETPVVNHLVIEGTSYGTENYSTTITLTGDYNFTHTYTGHLGANNVMPSYLAFYGSGCVSDFIVDNVTIEGSTLTPGDADGDNDVDEDDLAALSANWLTASDATWAMGDFNGDHAVNDIDATILASNWTGSLPASVPEPGSMLLLIIGSVFCIARNYGRISGRILQLAILVVMVGVCLFGMNHTCFSEDYGFDYPLLFDWTLRPTAEGDVNAPLTLWPYGFHSVHNEITPCSIPGLWYEALDWRVRGSLKEVYNQNRPVAILLADATGPYDGGTDPDALTKIMDYLSYKGLRLDYVFMDIEDYETRDDNIAMVCQQVRGYSDPNINQAKIGNFEYHMGSHNPDIVTSYASNNLDVSMPALYQWGSYQDLSVTRGGLSPNDRSALFYGSLELLSKAARDLPSGDQLIPWIGNLVERDGYNPDPLTHEDSERLMQHVRLRGADGYYMWRSSQEDWYNPTYSADELGNEAFKTAMIEAWQELDWLFDDVDKVDIDVLNTDTNQSEGFEWSAVETTNGAALLISNLDNSSHTLTANDVLNAGMSSSYVVDIFGSTSGSILVAAGTHLLDTSVAVATSVPEPSSLLLLLSISVAFAAWAGVRRK